MKPAASTDVVADRAAWAGFWRLVRVVLAGLVPGLCRAADLSAASVTFTSDDPVVAVALGLIDGGDLADAERMLVAASGDGAHVDAAARAEFLEIARRVRYDYALDEAALVATVRELVPDATADEVAAWAAEARLASWVIDARRRLHRRAAENLFLFSPQARGRRDSVTPSPPATWSLVDHTKAVVAEATRTGGVRVLPMRFRITHTITVPADQAAIRPGSRVQAWLPFPQETDLQRDVRIVEASPGSPRVAAAGRLKPRAEGCLQRSVFLESVVSGPPHIVFTPEICREVAEICGTATSPLARARRIFRWVSRSIPWQAEDDYSTIPSVAVRGFTVRRGDCGVQNTLFITMCRIAGIPVRWQSGFEMRPATGIGMHDWAEIYVDPWGWLPADASYGVQASDDPRMANFFCGCRDSQRSECRCSRKAPRRHGGGRSRGFSGVWHLRRSRRNTEGLARPPRTPS